MGTCCAIAKNPKVLEITQFSLGASLGAPGDVRTCWMRKILTLPRNVHISARLN